MRKMTALLCVAMTVLLLGVRVAVPAQTAWQGVAEALGKSGTEMPGGIYRVGMPRTDLQVTLDGVELKPTFALGSWVAFAPRDGQVMVMGDLVLTESEVQPVMKKLQDGGLEITALHNHLLRAQPVTMYMHIAGHGDAVTLARALHDAIILSKTPLREAPPPPPTQIDLDTDMIDRTLGIRGQIANGVYQFSIPRAEEIKSYGMVVPGPMGGAEAINFQPTGGGKVAITGDFVLTANEVTPVMRTLRENGIDVTALHNHMLDDEPRLFFMHFWANEETAKLTRSLKAALDKVNVKKP
jgi:hypothetical protein